MDTFTIYLAGRMTWIPQFNFPRFDYISLDLRENHTWEGKRIIVISPAELDDPATRAEALASPDGAPGKMESGETWGDFLSRDLKLIADGKVIDGVHRQVEGIVGMEEWWLSKGARTETFNARVLDKPLIRYDEKGELRLANLDEIAKAHHLSTAEVDRYYQATKKAA